MLRSLLAIYSSTLFFLSAHVSAQSLPPGWTQAEAVAARAFTRDILYGTMVAICKDADYAKQSALEASLSTWKHEHAASVAEGITVALKKDPAKGSTEAAWRSTLGTQIRSEFEPKIRVDVATNCASLLGTLSTGLPVPFSGQTLTSTDLRSDIWKQLPVAVMCLKIESINASVTSTDPATQATDEQWLINGCGKPVPATVHHAPSPAGGTNFYIKLDPNTLKPEEMKARLQAAKAQAEAQKPGNAANAKP